MKKYLAILVILSVTLLSSVGCGNKADASGIKVDVDLTEFSKTMMIAMIDNIYAKPNEYMDKTIKMRGQYSMVYYEDFDLRFHYILSSDDESCCAYGFIFEYNGTYPDDFPDEGEDIEVYGVFGRDEALDQIYHYLAVDDITFTNQS